MAPNWPEEYGGAGFTPTQKYIFESEMAREGAPRTIPFGLSMVAPVIMEFGSQEQKDKFLPKIVEGKWSGTMCLTEPVCGTGINGLLSSLSGLLSSITKGVSISNKSGL